MKRASSSSIIQNVLLNNKIEGERRINYYRGFFLLLSISILLLYIGLKNWKFSGSDRTDLTVISLSVLHFIGIAVYLRRRRYHRLIGYLSSTIDIALLMTSVYGIRWGYNPSLSTVVSSCTLVGAFFLIIISLRRQDPWNTLYTGMLAGLLYAGIIIIMKKEGVFEKCFFAADGTYFVPSLSLEILKVLIFMTTGAAGFIIANNYARLFWQSIQADYEISTIDDKYRDAFSRMQVGAFRIELRSGRLLEYNKTTAIILSPGDTSSGTAGSFWSYFTDSSLRYQIQKSIDSKGFHSFMNAHIKTAQGKECWIDGSLSLTGDSDILEGFIVDASERKKTEEHIEKLTGERIRLNKKIQLDQPLTAIGMNLSGFLHNIRGHLREIFASSENLKKRFENSCEDTVFCLEGISNAAEVILTMAERQKEIALSRGGHEPAAINLQDVIETAIQTISSNPDVKTNVKFELNAKPILWKGSLADILPVFYNLIQNAKDAVMENMSGGCLVKIDLDDDERSIIFRVGDNGTGIGYCTDSRCRKDSCMTCFYQDFGVTTKATGSGLGLWTVKEFLRKSGGDIIFRSRKNEGTTVTISLPKE